ncbi:hypothetical protein J132_11211 [Termitomyces sp. J132]|nr:hypothetical protein H2248_002363 [Termitomyces sp. 'cryptogamus']KNZ78572.1 hypothetical protein J132_11211 [Termitomyces sp. J132]
MAFDLPPVRMGLYAVLGFFSFLLFCLSAARLGYTTNLPEGDPLNGGRNFYDPIVVELLFTTLMTMPWCGYVTYCIYKRFEARYLSTFRDELIMLVVLWFFWIIGAAIASSIWGDLTWCSQFNACRVLSALEAFAWLGWIALTMLVIVSALFGFANKAFLEPLHGRWDPRASIYNPSSKV